MNNSRFLESAWTSVAFNNQLVVVGVKNPNSKLFFGKDILNRMIAEIPEEVEDVNRLQADKLVEELVRMLREKRDGYLNYFSFPVAQACVQVVAHTEYIDDEHLFLHVMEVQVGDLYRSEDGIENEYTILRQQIEGLYLQMNAILDSLPVGVELYTSDGQLIFLNNTDCRTFGVDRLKFMEKSGSIFENPNLPETVKEALRKGEKIHIHFPYSFALVADSQYYHSNKSDTSLWIKCIGQPIFNTAGEYERYVFIVEDVTDSIHLEEELQQSKQKTELAMHAADIVLWEFDVRTLLFISENEPLNNYDHTLPIPLDEYVKNIHPEDLPKIIPVLEKVLKGEDEFFCFDFRLKYPNEIGWQYCTISGSPYEKDENGKVIRFVGFRKNNTDLQKRKQLQDNILDSIPLPILIKDVEDNLRYFFCNAESKRMFGTSEDITAYDILEPEQVEQMRKTDMEVFTTGKPYFGQERIALKDGRVYETIVQKSVIYDGEKRLLLNVRWDKSRENELERQAKVLSISMDVMDAYNWFYDPISDTISFGKGFERLRREEQDVDTFQKFITYVHPEDRMMLMRRMRVMMGRESGDFVVEYRIDLSGDKHYEWWECRGMVETTIRYDQPYKYMFGMSVNIQGHKTTELTLLKNKEELKQLIRQNELVLNNTNSGLAFISMNYIVQWENISICSASLTYEAYKKGEYCYKSAHGRTSPCDNCVLQRAMVSRQVEKIKFFLNNSSTVEIFATPVFDATGEMEGIVIRVDDVTEREKMIADLQQAKLLAEQSDKLKSAFLANMSHEIRTPLNAIVGFSDLLMNASDKEEEMEYMQIINTNNELLLKLINDILDLSKIEAGSLELKYAEFDFSEHFNSLIVAMEQRIVNPNVRLFSVNPYTECRVKLDKNRVTQIITNYVTNAIKYTPKGFIEMGYERVKEGIRFYVRDTGIGISKEKRERVFHRFEKLDEFAQGTGLGLSICKAIAESMGGSVGFESEYGNGSLFWAILPCEVSIQNEKNIKSIKNKTEQTKRIVKSAEIGTDKVILVAEDIQSNYLLVSAMLHEKCTLIRAKNGREAVDIVKTQKIDLVLMDMKMPVMDGLKAVSAIRSFNTDIPMIALTAHAFDADREAALSAGCNDYLVKPINKEKLMTVLQKFL